MKTNNISNKTKAPVKINMEIVFDHANNCGSLIINGNPIKIDAGTIRTSEYGDELRICLTDQHCFDPEEVEIKIPYHLIEQAGLTDVYEKQEESEYFLFGIRIFTVLILTKQLIGENLICSISMDQIRVNEI